MRSSEGIAPLSIGAKRPGRQATRIHVRPPAVACERTNRSTPHVSRVLSRATVTGRALAIIPLGRASRRASSGLPASSGESPYEEQAFACSTRLPTRPCSRWGLPCRPCCHVRGGLLPRRFTLTVRSLSREVGGLFSVALSSASPQPGVTWHRALWSSDFPPVALRSRMRGARPAIACVMSAGRGLPPSCDARKRHANRARRRGPRDTRDPGEMVQDAGTRLKPSPHISFLLSFLLSLRLSRLPSPPLRSLPRSR